MNKNNFNWRVVKINGVREEFDIEKVVDSVFLAAQDVGGTDKNRAQGIGDRVQAYLTGQFGNKKEISTRDIGDAVERVLMEQHHIKTAKAYILNRDKKREETEAKIRLGVNDDVGMKLNSLVVMKKKYLQDNETPREAFDRVAKALAGAEKTESLKQKWFKEFSKVMRGLKFLPGGRTLANAGTKNNQLANCFVLPFPDDIEGIFEVVKESSVLKKNGGGVGFSFSEVRPKGDIVSTTSGRACGPVALMDILDHASNIFLQAGGRRSGNMVTLAVDHPDIFEFIACKESGKNLPNINYSLEVSDRFMKAFSDNKEWPLLNRRTGEVVQRVSARAILEQAARLAWTNGDPGLIFIDEINRYNPTPHVSRLNTVNLCGEQPLLSYEACNLGSVNLANHVKPLKGKQSCMGDYEIDWTDLENTVRVGVRLLDDVVSVCKYPLEKIDKVVKSNRKIGLGIMGWADLLVMLGVAYDSDEAFKLAEKVMKFVQKTAWDESESLAKEKGSFPNFAGSIWEKRGFKKMRNATLTTIAPTGSISMIAGCSYGIEPHFALAFYKKAMGGFELPEVNEDLVVTLKRHNGTYSSELMGKIAQAGSVQHILEVPKKIREVFVTAMDISFDNHVKMQASFQKYTDNAVSKTINMSSNATVDEVMGAYLLAWKLKCKGITVYRDRSRGEQVLNIGNREQGTGNSEKSNKDKCPECGGKITKSEGCVNCESCGYSACSV